MIDSGSFSPIANLFLMELVEPAAFFSVVDGVFSTLLFFLGGGLELLVSSSFLS